MKKILFIAIAAIIVACTKEYPAADNPAKQTTEGDTNVIISARDTMPLIVQDGKYTEKWINYLCWSKANAGDSAVGKPLDTMWYSSDLFIFGMTVSLNKTIYAPGDSITCTGAMNIGYGNIDPSQQFPLNLTIKSDGAVKLVYSSSKPINSCQAYTFTINVKAGTKIGNDTLDIYFQPTTFPNEWAGCNLSQFRKKTYAKLSTTHILVPYTVK